MSTNNNNNNANQNPRGREKMSALLRRLFKGSSRKEGQGACGGGGGGGSSANSSANGVGAVATGSKQSPSASPARRILRGHCRDTVSPAPQRGAASAFGAAKKGQIEIPGSKSVRARRLMKEYRDLQRLQHSKTEPVFTVELVDDNLFEWHVKLYTVDPESDLWSDMAELGIAHILLHITFPENFPFAPPFMRVISPRIEKGFVMEGGAICMELLTPRGWASAYTVEAVIMQFAASVVKGQGRVQRKNKGHQKGFSKRSAEESFRSLVKTHDKYGWVTPSLADG